MMLTKTMLYVLDKSIEKAVRIQLNQPEISSGHKIACQVLPHA
jgi:hypothetical protein